MKKYLPIISLGATLAFAGVLPGTAFAHEHDTFVIGGKQYQIIIGSLSEPLVVDDKSGVDLRVSSNGAPVTGLENTLQVELQAGDKKKTIPLEPAETAGAYTAVFIPTVETTYTYRLFGTIEGNPVDLSFTCNDSISEDAKDETRATFANRVVRTEKIGAFGCPEAKTDFGFPESAAAQADLASQIQAVQSAERSASGAKPLAITGIALGALGIALSLGRMRRK